MHRTRSVQSTINWMGQSATCEVRDQVIELIRTRCPACSRFRSTKSNFRCSKVAKDCVMDYAYMHTIHADAESCFYVHHMYDSIWFACIFRNSASKDTKWLASRATATGTCRNSRWTALTPWSWWDPTSLCSLFTLEIHRNVAQYQSCKHVLTEQNN